ncbi:MAG: DnaA/Hda family protein, partial [Maricaulaceae bacterium]
MQPHFEFSQSARRGMSSRPVARAIRSHEARENAPRNEPSDQSLEAAQALSVFSTRLKQVLGAERWTSWGKDLRVGDADEDMVRVFAPTAVHRERLMNSIGARKLREMWMDVDPLGRTLDLRAASETSARAVRRPSSAARAVSGAASAPTQQSPAQNLDRAEEAATGRAGPQVGDQPPATFDNFVEGGANKYAYASARTIAYDEEPPYKVLVITGAYGGGKSHLLAAIAHAFEERGDGDQLLACNADDFRADFVKSLREKTGVDFKTRVKKARVLVIDDIHRLESSKKTQEELSNIVCSVVDAGGRVIIAADRPVSKLDILDPQLASRLSGAVNTQIEQPDLDHRRRILQKMASLNPMAKRGVEIPEAVLDY